MNGNGDGPTQPWEEDYPELVWMAKLAAATLTRGGWVKAAHQYPHRPPCAHVEEMAAVFVNGLVYGLLLYENEPDFAQRRVRELAAATGDPDFFRKHHREQAARIATGDYT